MTVVPVVEYEPDAGRAGAPTAHRRSDAAVRHLTPVPTPPSPRFRAAATFTDAALRAVLEVIDRRRPATQLRALLATGLIDPVVAFTRATPDRRTAAVLRRVRLQPTGPEENSYEAAATYTRGRRTHAVACRVELVDAPQGRLWQVVALHLG